MTFRVGQLLQAQLHERYDRWLIKTAPVTLAAAEQDLVIEQGRRLRLRLQWRELRGDDGTEADVSPTGWTFTMQGAKDYGGAALFTVVGAVAADDTLVVEFVLSAVATAALTGWSRGVYDIVATSASDTVRLVRGQVTLSLKAAGS